LESSSTRQSEAFAQLFRVQAGRYGGGGGGSAVRWVPVEKKQTGSEIGAIYEKVRECTALCERVHSTVREREVY
jgi:hypothetical protein